MLGCEIWGGGGGGQLVIYIFDNVGFGRMNQKFIQKVHFIFWFNVHVY